MSDAPPSDAPPAERRRAEGMAAPLRYPVFRRMWLASLMSNLGLLIQGVGAAWIMTEMTARADLVALVQTAQMLPVMLFALGAGAIADMYDRRKVQLAAVVVSFTGAAALSALAWFGAITPAALLGFCFVIGCGMALLWPAWQASVGEQVPGESLPAAIALNSISYNVARSIGPAIGGVIVAVAGAVAAFAVNAVLYIPLLLVLLGWRRVQEPPRFPPESLARAIVSGVRYVSNSPPIRVVLARTLITGLLGASLFGLLPLVARDLLGGDARTFGLLLGAFGVGAVAGALVVPRARRRFTPQQVVAVSTLLVGLGVLVVGLSLTTLVTAAALVVAGAAWMLTFAILNIAVQFAAPRWVSGRAVATFQAGVSGGIALGAWGWGLAARAWGVQEAFLLSGAGLVLLPLIGVWLRVPEVAGQNLDAQEPPSDPEVRLALTSRSGPIQIEVEYEVDPADARAFHGVMQELQLVRQRNGAYGWTLSRDIARPEIWVEYFSCPTWLDYLRQRSRATQAERELVERAFGYHRGPHPVRISRRLERPFGSVRWKAEAPDKAEDLPAATPRI